MYNAFVHELDEGVALPAPRAAMAIAAASGLVTLFGGTGGDGQPTGTLWHFDTTVAPKGAFTMIADQAGFARAGQLLVPIGADHLPVAPSTTIGHYRVTGVKTFMVSYDGLVLEKDLGPDSLNIVKNMELYNPDKTWRPTDDGQ